VWLFPATAVHKTTDQQGNSAAVQEILLTWQCWPHSLSTQPTRHQLGMKVAACCAVKQPPWPSNTPAIAAPSAAAEASSWCCTISDSAPGDCCFCCTFPSGAAMVAMTCLSSIPGALFALLCSSRTSSSGWCVGRGQWPMQPTGCTTALQQSKPPLRERTAASTTCSNAV